MRFSALYGFAIASLLGLSCFNDRLSGPEAQAAVARVRIYDGPSIDGHIVFIDGKRVSSQDALRDLDPRRVRSIEIIKARAAESLYGTEARRGAILIYTSSDSASGRSQ